MAGIYTSSLPVIFFTSPAPFLTASGKLNAEIRKIIAFTNISPIVPNSYRCESGAVRLITHDFFEFCHVTKIL